MLNENTRSSDRILTERILDDPDMILKIENPSLKQQMAVDTPAPAACFMAVERMLKAELLPVPGVLNAARELILQMKKDKADGRSSGAAIEKFLDEVKPIKN